MPESLIMPDNYLVALAISDKLLATVNQLIEYLEPQYSVSKYIDYLFFCLQTNCPSLVEKPETNLSRWLLYRAQRKANFQALCISKNMKNIDNPNVV